MIRSPVLLLLLYISIAALAAPSPPLCAVVQSQYKLSSCNDVGYNAALNTVYAPCGACVGISGIYLSLICDPKANTFTTKASYDSACAKPQMTFDFSTSRSCLAVPGYGFQKWTGFVNCSTTSVPTTAKPPATTAKPPATTAKPPATTLKPSVATPQPPSTAKPQATTSKATTAKPATPTTKPK